MTTIKQPTLVQDLGMLYPTATSKSKYRYGIYLCECGVEFKTQTSKIKSGHTKSCGCYQKKRTSDSSIVHGFRNHTLYPIWNNMIHRTTNQKFKQYSDYGGRGISVCQRWLNVSNFIEDMYSSYKDGLTLDRIDVNGNYEPSNCRWATRVQQSRNTRLLISTNKPGYRGVSLNKNQNKWVAYIAILKNIYLGSFDTALEAAKAYDRYVIDNDLEHTINGVWND